MHITNKIYYLLPLPHPKDVGVFDVTSVVGVVGTTKVGSGGGEDIGITIILNIIINNSLKSKSNHSTVFITNVLLFM